MDLQSILGDIHQLRVSVNGLLDGGAILQAINAAGGVVTPQAQTWFDSTKPAIVRHTLNMGDPIGTLSASANDTIKDNAREAERIMVAIVDEASPMTIADFRQRGRILDGKVADLESKVAAIRRPMNAGRRRKTRKGKGKGKRKPRTRKVL